VVDTALSDTDRRRLLEDTRRSPRGVVEGDRARPRAIEYASGGPADPLLTDILTKHTSGYGILEDLFADPRVTDVYVTSPVAANPIRVVVDGESMPTNVQLTPNGARALASRVRRTSGRAFSRASPTVDATASLGDGTGIRSRVSPIRSRTESPSPSGSSRRRVHAPGARRERNRPCSGRGVSLGRCRT